ncbi:MAG TPA: DUF1552 domain-containing protein [Polyangiaceae bacterium]|nr:DUF1552 domain-containing protein [Polyangiaceae bacterium]
MTNPKYSRRLLLQSLGVGAAFLPLLQAEVGQGQALAAPKRLVTVAWGHGVCGPYYYPGTDTITIDEKTGQCLSALAPFQSKMLMVCGLDNKAYLDHGRKYDGHSGYPGLFTGTHDGSGKSIDQAVADGLRAKGVNKAGLHLVVGIEPDGNTISYSGGGGKNTPERDPWKLFERLFSGATLPPDQLAKIVAHRQSMLDYVGKDLEAFGARLGRDDKSKIDAHLQAIRELENQLAAGGGGKGCAPPMLGDSRSLDTPTRSSLMFSLVGAAMRCDITRVVSMTFYDDHGKFNIRFPWLNIGDDLHPLAHQGAAGYPTKSKIDAWLFSQVALLAKDLEATPEAGKTALDNSVIVVSSDMNDGASHSVESLPFLLIGSCGGAIKANGRALKLGKWAGKTSNWKDPGGVPHNKLLASLSNAMDVPVTSFGEAGYDGTLDSELRS